MYSVPQTVIFISRMALTRNHVFIFIMIVVYLSLAGITLHRLLFIQPFGCQINIIIFIFIVIKVKIVKVSLSQSKF